MRHLLGQRTHIWVGKESVCSEMSWSALLGHLRSRLLVRAAVCPEMEPTPEVLCCFQAAAAGANGPWEHLCG